jgi:putative DNA primase/helicase
VVRQALVWAGEADPCGVMERIRGDDPSRQNLAFVLVAWHAAFWQDAVTAAEAVNEPRAMAACARPWRSSAKSVGN